MKIRKFKATKVRGYLNFDIEFDLQLTFLIGINGSGKTTALKLIQALITPSYELLAQIDFEEAQLFCVDSMGKEFKLSAIYLEINKIKICYDDLCGELKSDEFLISNEIETDETNTALKDNQNIRMFYESEIVKIIQKLGAPIFLGLNRRMQSDMNIDKTKNLYSIYSWRRKLTQRIPRDILALSLIDIQELIFLYVRYMAKEQPKYVEEFKNKLLQNSFTFIQPEVINFSHINNVNLVEQRMEVLKAIEDLAVPDIKNNINGFFDDMDAVLQRNIKSNLRKGKNSNSEDMQAFSAWFINNPQLKRIENIIKLNNDYKEKVVKLREPIKKLEKIISNYLQESQKELLVEGDGVIKIKLKNGEMREIYELSSGEKQIIIMIAHLLFYEALGKPGIFIVDEPELSLHLSWQEMFVNSIQEASPSTQFILATHAPTIIGKLSNEKYCFDLSLESNDVEI